MRPFWIIRSLLALFVATALVLAPMPSARAHGMAAAMEAGMPCCPDDSPSSHDACKDCAQMVLCSLKIFQAMPVLPAGLEARESIVHRLTLASAFAIDELATPPPARPPRS